MFDEMDAPSAALLGAQKRHAASPVSRSSCSACSPGTRFGTELALRVSDNHASLTLARVIVLRGRDDGTGQVLQTQGPCIDRVRHFFSLGSSMSPVFVDGADEHHTECGSPAVTALRSP
jgi:hypothetical protein